MNKAALIANLIACGAFLEGEKSYLETLDVKRLKTLSDGFTKPSVPAEGTTTETTPTPTGNATLVLTNNNAGRSKPQTPAEFIDSAPPAIKGMLANGLRAYEKQRTALITRITSNAKNKFKPEQLAGMETDFLENLAEVATPAENADIETYEGLADAFSPDSSGSSSPQLVGNAEPGLSLPKEDWNKR